MTHATSSPPKRMQTLQMVFKRFMQIAFVVSILSTLTFIAYLVRDRAPVLYTTGNLLLYLAIGIQVLGGIALLLQLLVPPQRDKKAREFAVVILALLPWGFVIVTAFILLVHTIRRVMSPTDERRQAVAKEAREELTDEMVNAPMDLASNTIQNAASATPAQPTSGAHRPTITMTVQQIAGPRAAANLAAYPNRTLAIFMVALIVSILLSSIVAVPRALVQGGAFSAGSAQTGLASGTTEEFPVPTANAGLQGITAGKDGNLWFVESTSGIIGRITPSGKITEFPIIANSNQVNSPTEIAAAADGSLWFTEGTQIGQITANGVIRQFQVIPASDPSDALGGICAGPDGNIWFTEGGPSADPNFSTFAVGYITPGGTVQTFTARPQSSTFNPWEITAGPDGNLWFTEPPTYGTVYNVGYIGRVTLAGSITEFSVPPGKFSADSLVSYIAAGPDHNIWFTHPSATGIGRITPAGAVQLFPTTASQGFGGIVAGPGGNLWYIGGRGGSAVIERMTPTGSIKDYPLTTTKSNPYEIAVGPDGNLWFTDAGTNAIGRIVP